MLDVLAVRPWKNNGGDTCAVGTKDLKYKP